MKQRTLRLELTLQRSGFAHPGSTTLVLPLYSYVLLASLAPGDCPHLSRKPRKYYPPTTPILGRVIIVYRDIQTLLQPYDGAASGAAGA